MSRRHEEKLYTKTDVENRSASAAITTSVIVVLFVLLVGSWFSKSDLKDNIEKLQPFQDKYYQVAKEAAVAVSEIKAKEVLAKGLTMQVDELTKRLSTVKEEYEAHIAIVKREAADELQKAELTYNTELNQMRNEYATENESAREKIAEYEALIVDMQKELDEKKALLEDANKAIEALSTLAHGRINANTTTAPDVDEAEIKVEESVELDTANQEAISIEEAKKLGLNVNELEM